MSELPPPPMSPMTPPPGPAGRQSGVPYRSERKLTAGILGLLVGAFGVHKFYLGYTKEGVIQIVLTVVTCGLAGVVGFVEGILYLVMPDEQFDETYVAGRKGWF